MKRAEIWRSVAAEHLVKAQTSEDAREAALHMSIASDLHARALSEELHGFRQPDVAKVDFDRLRTTLRQILPRN